MPEIMCMMERMSANFSKDDDACPQDNYIGTNSPEKLMSFIAALEKALSDALGFKPETSIEEGLRRFAEWYVGYYGVR